MTRARIPFIIVVIALLAAGFVVERDHQTEVASAPDLGVARHAPMTVSPDALGSTWYCAAGSSDEEGVADHTVVIANPADRELRAELTAFPGQADPVSVVIEVPANSIERVLVNEVVAAPATAVMVEADGGELAVTHDLEGPLGRDGGPCASASSDIWHFAWGDTSRDVRSLMVLFNPFPGDAVVDFSFVTIDGPREPRALTGVVVPGRSVVVVDVGAEVARRDQVSTTVTARTGRVVAERLQTFDDTEEMLEGADPRRGLTVDLGVPVPAEVWVHPSVRLAEGLVETIVVYNPGSATAEVDVEVLLGDRGLGGVEPFELSVPPNRYETVDLTDQPRLVEHMDDGPVDATVIVRSLNDVAVVAERMTMVPTTANGPGVSASVGMPVVGRHLVMVDPRPQGSEGVTATVVNLDPDRLVTGSIAVLSRGVERPLDGFEEFELAPGGRVTIDDLIDRVSGAGTSILVIETSHPVAAGISGRVGDPPDRFAAVGISRADDAELPPGLAFGS